VYTFLIILHIIVSIILVLSILMQSSKGGLSGTFGGEGAALFGGRGAATFLSKITSSFATAFIVLAILISIVSTPKGESTSIIKQQANKRIAPAAELPVPQGSMESTPIEPKPAE